MNTVIFYLDINQFFDTPKFDNFPSIPIRVWDVFQILYTLYILLISQLFIIYVFILRISLQEESKIQFQSICVKLPPKQDLE